MWEIGFTDDRAPRIWVSRPGRKWREDKNMFFWGRFSHGSEYSTRGKPRWEFSTKMYMYFGFADVVVRTPVEILLSVLGKIKKMKWMGMV
jgi:hypothetical protein